MLKGFFFGSVFIIVYTYLLYPILLLFAKKNKLNNKLNDFTITAIIPAYNEIKYLNHKINNTKTVLKNYTSQIIVVTSGSTDGSEKLEWEGVVHIKDKLRKGKPNAINSALPFVNGQLILLTDANTIINDNALPVLIQHFNNEKVAMVCGEKQLQNANNVIPIENLYWNFESNLKAFEFQFNTVIGAAGECILIKKEFLLPIPEQIILDDFWLSTKILIENKIVAYENTAIATETASIKITDELKRRIRIASGVMQWFVNVGVKDFWKYNTVTKWQFFSHRFCRWFLMPIAILICTICLLLLSKYLFYYILLIIFCSTLIASCFAFFFKSKIKLLHLPFYFLLIHGCMCIGYFKYFLKKHTILWEKASR